MVQAVVFHRRPLAVFIALLLSLLVLMSYQVTDRATGRTLLGSLVFRAFSPIQYGVAAAIDSVGHAINHYIYLVDVDSENQRLRNQLTETKIHLAAIAHESEENKRLRGVLGLRQEMPFQLLAGEVIGRNARAGFSEKATVNRGSNDGVRLSMPVVTPTGVVGTTVMVGSISSQVQLITDPSAAVGAMLQRGRVSGLLSGAGNGLCILKFLPVTTDLRRDDVVLTSGQDGVFPEGMRLGIVTREIHESEYYKSVEVKPYENFSMLQQVVFILKASGEANP